MAGRQQAGQDDGIQPTTALEQCKDLVNATNCMNAYTKKEA